MSSPTVGLRFTAEDRDARKEWVDRNPLRAWRRSQDPKLGIYDAAVELGVGTSMMQMYEKGVHLPSGDRADAFARILGPDWRQTWDEWLATRPTPSNA